MKALSKRQEQILKIIVEQHSKLAVPIGSKLIENLLSFSVSSATIRNEMSNLEKLDYLEKTHTSSGRIPSTKGYMYYNSNLLNNDLDSVLKSKLRLVFAKRYSNISEVIQQSMNIIGESTNSASLVIQNFSEELLKRIDLIPITSKSASILIVTSSGNISSNLITLDKESNLDEIAVCIRIFNDRLIDCKMSELYDKIKSIEPLLRKQINDYEYIVQEVINRAFMKKEKFDPKISGTKNIIAQPEFSEKNKLIEVINLLEDVSIWKKIAMEQSKTGRTMISFGGEHGIPNGISVASTSINTGLIKHQVSIIGPKRMDYSQVQNLLDFIKKEIEENWR
jgi:heat-inducible transcriptional repressor